MKKTVSMIYRLSFIIFSVWAVFQNIGFNILNIYSAVFDISIVSAAVSMLCVACAFLQTADNSKSAVLSAVKMAATVFAGIVLALGFSDARDVISNSWILNVLLPIMMLADWLLFDDKGRIKWYHPLLWLAAVLAFLGALYIGMKRFFNVPWLTGIITALFTPTSLARLFGGALITGLLMYLLDSVLSGKKRGNIISLVYRILFLLAEAYGFYLTAGRDLNLFIGSLADYRVLSNFLAFLFMLVTVSFNAARLGQANGKSAPLLRLKGAFVIALAADFIGFRYFMKNTYPPADTAALIQCLIAPCMLLADWLLFDTKNRFKAYDPFLWLIVPTAYGAASLAAEPWLAFPETVFHTSSPFTALSELFILLAVGYALFLTDKIRLKD